MNKNIFALMLVLGLANPVSSFAQYNSGSTPKACVVNDIKVRSTVQNNFSDNLSASNFLFKSGDMVEYSVVIENNSGVDLKDTSVSFILPSCTSLVFGPNQKEATNNTLKWSITDLKAREQKTYTVRAKIEGACSQTKLTATSSAVCRDGGSSTDRAVIYTGKPTVPDTGTADIALKTIMVAGLIGVGLNLRKLVRGY